MGMVVEEIEKVIVNLPQGQLKKFRAWFEKFDSNSWDEQIENDIAIGKLDALANVAISDHKAGRSTKL